MGFFKLYCGPVLSAILLTPYLYGAEQHIPTCITGGFTAGGPIIIGEITSAHLNLDKGSPSATIAITRYIRGPRLDQDTVEVMVDLGNVLSVAKALLTRRTIVYINAMVRESEASFAFVRSQAIYGRSRTLDASASRLKTSGLEI